MGSMHLAKPGTPNGSVDLGRTSDRVEEAGQPLGEFLHRYLHSYALPDYLFVFFYLFVAMNIETSNARGLPF